MSRRSCSRWRGLSVEAVGARDATVSELDGQPGNDIVVVGRSERIGLRGATCRSKRREDAMIRVVVAGIYATLLDLLRTDPRVVAVYGFGSAARGDPCPRDVDVAVLLKAALSWSEEGDLRAAVRAVEPRADLVILNDAPPVLRWEVLSGGRCLVTRDPAALAEFEISSLSRFLDLQPVRRLQAEYLRARVAERRGPAG